VITALLFTIGKHAIGLYLGNGSVSSVYGAAGSVIVILVWVYYSAQILLIGAEFTKVYAKRIGQHVKPKTGAVLMNDDAIEPQGSSREESQKIQESQKTPTQKRKAG
jgi:membrane protein